MNNPDPNTTDQQWVPHETALAAIDHVALYNSNEREEEAINMLDAHATGFLSQEDGSSLASAEGHGGPSSENDVPEWVSYNSAVAAIQHVGSYNGGDRPSEARSMLVAANPQTPKEDPVFTPGLEAIASDMRNFTYVADRADIPESSASDAIRRWAAQLDAIAQRPQPTAEPEGMWSLDDMHIGKSTNGNRSLSERIIPRPPNLSNSEWYAYGKTVIQALVAHPMGGNDMESLAEGVRALSERWKSKVIDGEPVSQTTHMQLVGCAAMLESLLDNLAQKSAAPPVNSTEKWRMVPTEPTEDMVAAIEYGSTGELSAPRKADRMNFLRKAIAAAPLPPSLIQSSSVVPEGWRLVPTEPTSAMCGAVEYGAASEICETRLPERMRFLRNAIAAAPQPPALTEHPAVAPMKIGDVETLRQVRALLMDTPSLQGREHVPLGIAFNDVIDRCSRLALSAAEAESTFFAQDFYEEARAGKVAWPGQQSAATSTPVKLIVKAVFDDAVRCLIENFDEHEVMISLPLDLFPEDQKPAFGRSFQLHLAEDKRPTVRAAGREFAIIADNQAIDGALEKIVNTTSSKRKPGP